MIKIEAEQVLSEQANNDDLKAFQGMNTFIESE